MSTPIDCRAIADKVHSEIGFPYTEFLERYTAYVLSFAAKLVLAERVDAEETQSDTDVAYNVALLHAAESIIRSIPVES